MALLERSSYLSELDSLLQQAASGHGRIVFLGGEAGAGKTALVSEFSRRSPGSARVLVGTCVPLSTPDPLGPLYDIARAAGPSLESAIRSAASRPDLFRSVLSELSEPARSLVIIEDAHWADDATLDLIRYLA